MAMVFQWHYDYTPMVRGKSTRVLQHSNKQTEEQKDTLSAFQPAERKRNIDVCTSIFFSRSRVRSAHTPDNDGEDDDDAIEGDCNLANICKLSRP